MSTFRKSLAALRKAKGLSQQEVAKKMGLTFDSYRQMEYRDKNPNFSTIVKLLGVLEAGIEDLFPELSRQALELDPDTRRMLEQFNHLSSTQRQAVINLVDSFS